LSKNRRIVNDIHRCWSQALVTGAVQPAIADLATESSRVTVYTDEESAAEAIAEYQETFDLDDQTIVAIWENEADPRRLELERGIFAAVDANGSVKRAQRTVPDGISLSVENALT
jgi:hypothetical protein